MISNETANAIEIKGLCKTYGERMAVDHLDLTVGKGELLALLGQNGAGKTTTIKMLCCLVAPTQGDAALLGDSILNAEQAVKQKLNVSPQETAVAPNLTVYENLIFIAKVYGHSAQQAKEKAEKLMADFDLTARRKDKAKMLSGGLQRRLSIAMALISEPEILFLDEPTLGLDVRARRELWHAVEALKGNITIVLTTHYLEEVEALSDRVAILSRGKLRALGTVDELKQQTGETSLEEIFLKLTDDEEVQA